MNGNFDGRSSVMVMDFDAHFPRVEIHYTGSLGYESWTDTLAAFGLRKCYLALFDHLLISLADDGSLYAAGGVEHNNAALPLHANVELFCKDGAWAPDVDLETWAYPEGWENAWDQPCSGDDSLTLREWAAQN